MTHAQTTIRRAPSRRHIPARPGRWFDVVCVIQFMIYVSCALGTVYTKLMAIPMFMSLATLALLFAYSNTCQQLPKETRHDHR